MNLAPDCFNINWLLGFEYLLRLLAWSATHDNNAVRSS